MFCKVFPASKKLIAETTQSVNVLTPINDEEEEKHTNRSAFLGSAHPGSQLAEIFHARAPRAWENIPNQQTKVDEADIPPLYAAILINLSLV